jgi:ATP-dependent RNA helicase RhlE
MTFESLNLLPELLRAVADQGYTEPTPIQAQAIPAILQRRDIMGCAQTGTGKTAGFTLPLLQLLAPQANASPSPARHPTRALVLTPTRELAAQVEESVRVYGKYLALRSTVVYGGVDIGPQKKALHGGVEILVATPGRLLDHLQQRTVNLSRVEFLVLDEADRMLDMGFLPDIKRILAVLPAQRQNLLFSATFSDDIRKLAHQLLRQPLMIEVARRNATADLVSHQVYEVPAARKRALLAHLIRSRNIPQALVFVRMKRDANRLARELVRDGINAAAIHSDRTQLEREQALADFKQGRSPVLVATDIAARGLDIEELPYVINYELPYAPEDYLHRIGRTARAGLPGEAISLMCSDETKLLVEIEKLLKRTLPRASAPEFHHEDRKPHRLDEHRTPAKPDRHDRHEKRHAPKPVATSKPKAPGIDFSKPYEPAPSTAPKPQVSHPLRRQPSHPAAALLGGFSSPTKSHK